MGPIDERWEVHQNEGELERTPSGGHRIGRLRMFASPSLERRYGVGTLQGHRSVREAERLTGEFRLGPGATQELDTLDYPLVHDATPVYVLAGLVLEALVESGNATLESIDPGAIRFCER